MCSSFSTYIPCMMHMYWSKSVMQRTLDVNQADGTIYFGYYDEICAKKINETGAECWIWPEIVPYNELFSYLYINQGEHDKELQI